MGGAFVAGTVVALVQFVRVRDRRLLLVAAMLACQSQALGREWYDVWRDVFQAGVIAAGMALVLSLSPRAHPVPPRRSDLPQPAPDQSDESAREGAVRA
jgi:hypothetical protein